MSNAVLFRFRDLKSINDEWTVNKMLSILVEIPNERQEGMWMRDKSAGNVCIFRHESFPGKVIEYVQGSKDDSVTTLYEEHPVFYSGASVCGARLDLINEIGRLTMSLPSTVAVKDEGRERVVMLNEMGLAQLQDLLAQFSHSDRRGL